MKQFVSLLLALVTAQLFVSCDKTKDDVMPDGFTRIILHPDYYTTPYNTPVTLSVLANDTVVGTAEVTMDTPAHGTLQPGTEAGKHVYKPAHNYHGSDTIRYQVCIGQKCETAFAIIRTEQPLPNCMPTAIADSVRTYFQHAVPIPVLENDQTCGPVTISLKLNKRGMARIEDDQIVFTPFPGFIGTVRITYEICNPNGCDTASVNITVLQPMPTPPPCNFVTRNDTVRMTSNAQTITSHYINVLENDLFCSSQPIDSLTVLFPGYSYYGWAEIDATTPLHHIKYSTQYSGYYVNWFSYRVCQTINNEQVCKTGLAIVYINP